MSQEDFTTNRRRVILGIGGAAMAGLAGCGGDGDDTETDTEGGNGNGNGNGTDTQTETDTPTGTANVRVAHVSPDAPNVDVYVDSGDPVLTDVPFGAVSSYLEVPAGERQVEITAAGDAETSVFDDAVTVEADTDYTLAAAGELDDGGDQPFEVLTLVDDNSEVEDGSARLRAVHASPDAPDVDITAAGGDVTLFDAVPFGESGTTTVGAGSYTVEIRGDTDSNDGDVVADFDVTLADGGVYTAFAAGYLNPDNSPGDEAFDLIVVQDAGPTGGTDTPTETDTPTGTANARVAHVSPDAPNVDVYVDGGDPVLTDVPFGAVSSYLEVPAGERQVEITAAGDASTSVFDDAITVAADTDYTIAAAGEISDGGSEPFAPIVLEDDNSEVADGSARLRAVHASPDAPAVDITAAGGEVTLFDGVPFGESGTTTVDAGSYTVEIRGDTDSNDGDVVADFDETLADGGVYTAFAAGYLNPGDAPGGEGFDLIVVHDAGDEPTANARVVHVSPDAPNVDVYVDGGDPVLADVPFGTVSDYLAVPAGDRQVEITAAGDASTSVFNSAVTVETDTDYTLAATGEISDGADQAFEVLTLVDDNSSVDSGMARLRAVHASPDAPAVDITAGGGDPVLFDAVEYTGSGYTTVAAGDYTVEVRADANDELQASFENVSLEDGGVHTAFAAGYLTPDDDPSGTSFDLIVAQDSGGSGMN